jgi:serralysin
MPSTNVFDPTNYTALIPAGAPRWHDGSGSVTFSLLSTIPSHYAVAGGFSIDGIFFAAGTSVALNAAQQANALLAVARFNEVANINMTQNASGGDISFGAQVVGDPGLFGFAYYPSTDPLGGDIWLNNANSLVANPTLYDEGWDTFIHELGHAVGLEHPFEGTLLPEPLENSRYTIMSYDPIPEQEGVADPAQQWPATPMLYDIQALQVQYGANMTTRAGATTYFSTGGPFEIVNGGSVICTIWDAGGIDTFSGALQTSAVSIDLRPGYFSTIGSIANNIGIALGVAGTGALSAIIENAIGGSASDVLQGNDVGNQLTGGGGADQLYGSGGLDQLYGGLGLDYMSGGTEADYLSGGGDKDTFFGGAGTDTIIGGFGDDDFYVQAGDVSDIIVEYAGQGNDRILSSISYSLVAGSEIETLSTDSNAGTVAINLTGSDLANIVIGNNGVNILDGRGGNDTLYGLGGGIDYFAFSTVANTSTNSDVIADWSSAGDLIFLDDAAFTGMAAGFLAASAFIGGTGLTSAVNAAHRVIFNTTNGDLWWDQDGLGGIASVRFANIGAGQAIFNYDFFGI